VDPKSCQGVLPLAMSDHNLNVCAEILESTGLGAAAAARGACGTQQGGPHMLAVCHPRPGESGY
jgi:hypothetical protein